VRWFLQGEMKEKTMRTCFSAVSNHKNVITLFILTLFLTNTLCLALNLIFSI
jgi:hypothetical protein